MGFYFRRSISFGGIRLNLSKSGVGISAGMKGFRFGTGPRGHYVHIGAGGLYYKTVIGKKRSRVPVMTSNNKEDKANQKYHDVILQTIESDDALNIHDSSSEDLLKEINEKYKKFPLWVFGIVLTLLLSSTVFVILGFVSILVLYLIDKYRKTILIVYDIDEVTETKIQTFYDTFNEIMEANKKWHISASGQVRDRKYHAGASTLIKRNNISIHYSIPKYMRTNVKVPCVPVGKQKLYFFPDKILIVQSRKVGAVSYGNIKVNYANTRFIEDGVVPRDTTVVGQTWKYVNKSGGPDRRFKNNRQLPIVLYSEFTFCSETGLNEMIQVSKPNIGDELIRYLNHYDFSYIKMSDTPKTANLVHP